MSTQRRSSRKSLLDRPAAFLIAAASPRRVRPWSWRRSGCVSRNLAFLNTWRLRSIGSVPRAIGTKPPTAVSEQMSDHEVGSETDCMYYM